MVLAAVLVLLWAPAAARAQAPPEIDAYPLNVVADGRGGLQITVDGHDGGEFAPSKAKPAEAGLEMREGDSFSPPSDAGREVLDGPKLSDDRHTISSRYLVGPALEVSEQVTAADIDPNATEVPSVRLEYTIKNVGANDVAFKAGQIADLVSPVDDRATGIRTSGPTFVGSLDRLGRRVGLEQVTPWSHTQAGTPGFVRSNFRLGSGLDDGLGDGFYDLAVGAQWDRVLPRGEQTKITVLWRVPYYRSTYVVNTTADHDDGVCSDADCTLREAVRYAPERSVILLGAGTFTLNSRQIVVDRNLTLGGKGARTTIIDAHDSSRIFELRAGKLEVFGIQLTGGNGEPGGSVPEPFAAARAEADVPAGSGGAVAVQKDAALTMIGSAVTKSTARLAGGGIASEGMIELFDTLIAGNTATAGNGGGIAATGREQPLGAVYLHVTNSTVSGNAAPLGAGGGLYNEVPLSLDFATIAYNQAKSGGGGVHLADVNGVHAGSALLAKNTPAACSGLPKGNTGYDLADDASCGLTGPGDIEGVDAAIEPLADNGGPTDTHALKPASPAVDHGDHDACPSADQRGRSRLDDQMCDIGAYELAAQTFEPVGRISGRPLDVSADGLGELQIRPNDAARGVFAGDEAALASAGLAFVQGGVYYPAGGPQVTDTTGQRTPVSGPLAAITGAGGRRLVSVYYVGGALEVTETVSYTDGERAVRAHYAIRNASEKSVSFRAAQLAALNRAGRGSAGPAAVGVTAADEAGVRIAQGASAWGAHQVGRSDKDSSVYFAFVNGGLRNTVDDAPDDDQLGVEWKVDDLEPGKTRELELTWELADATKEVAVTTTEDNVDENCTAIRCTLRAALEDSPPGAVIRLPKGDYALSKGPLVSTADHIVRGAGAEETVIRGLGGARALSVNSGALGLSGVRITGGDAPLGNGGGIRVDGEASLSLADSRVDHNKAAGRGGGIFLEGPATLVRTTVDANTAVAIHVNGEPPTGGEGGGIAVGNSARVSLVNTTISGNSAELAGGGLSTHGVARIINVTITDNAAPAAAGLQHFANFGFDAAPDFLGPDLLGVIVAGNRGATACGGDHVIQSRFSLADDQSCELVGPGDAVVSDAELSPLAGNGGTTATHALLAGSPAVNRVIDGRCPTGDQRGVLRPSGGNCDAGAFERSGTAPPTITSPPEGAVLNTRRVRLTGTAPGESEIEVREAGVLLGSDDVGASGTWAVEFTVSDDGFHTFEVTHDESEPAFRVIRVDTLAPPAPALNATANGSTVTLSGAAFGDTVSLELFDAATSLGFVDLVQGEYTQVLTGVAAGPHTYVAVASDAAGNLSTSEPRQVTVAAPPPPPPLPAPTLDAVVTGSEVTLSGLAVGATTVALFDGAQSLGTAPVGPDGAWTLMLSAVAAGEHSYSAIARDAAGQTSAPSPARSVTVAQTSQVTPTPTPSPTPTPTPSPTPTPEPPLPPPVTGKQVNVEVKSGKVLLKVPGSNRFVALGEGQQIPVGTTVDTTQGRVTLTSTADATGKTQTADFYDGIFKVSQTKGAKPVTVLELVEPLSCPKGRRASAAAKKKKARKLWGSGKGAFRTTGSYSAATVRGTVWLTQDTCSTTLTRVTQGVVEVRDLVKRRTVLVKAGKRYTARARK